MSKRSNSLNSRKKNNRLGNNNTYNNNRNSKKHEVVIVSPKTSFNYNPKSKISDQTQYSIISTNISSSSTDSSEESSTGVIVSHHNSSTTTTSTNTKTISKVSNINNLKSNLNLHTPNSNSLNTSVNQSNQHVNSPNHDHDHDRISLSSLNTVLDDIGKPRRDSQTISQRRSSVLRRNWAQHTDVPYVIGAYIPDDTHGACGKILLGLSWFLMIIFFPLSLFITLKVVQEYERAVIFRLGRLVKGGAKGPGLFIVLPCIESYTKVDMRTVSFDVPPQEVLTKDSVTVAVDAVVYYRVFNPVISIANVENSQESTRLLAQTSLRNVLGTNSLAEILSNREAVSFCMREILDEATDQWGIKVERVEIKDVRLPIQLQRAMAAEAEATREARAKVIAAEGEHKASRALKEAADILSQSSSAIQLRYLQTLNNIAAEKNSTIVFPLPVEVLSNFMNYTTAKTEQINRSIAKSSSRQSNNSSSNNNNNNNVTNNDSNSMKSNVNYPINTHQQQQYIESSVERNSGGKKSKSRQREITDL